MWKATASRSKTTLAKVRDEASVEVSKGRSELNTSAARHHQLLVSICRVVKGYEARKDKVKLYKIYDDGRKVTVRVHVAIWDDLRERVLSLTNGLKSGSLLELQTMLGLATEAAQL